MFIRFCVLNEIWTNTTIGDDEIDKIKKYIFRHTGLLITISYFNWLEVIEIKLRHSLINKLLLLDLFNWLLKKEKMKDFKNIQE